MSRHADKPRVIAARTLAASPLDRRLEQAPFKSTSGKRAAPRFPFLESKFTACARMRKWKSGVVKRRQMEFSLASQKRKVASAPLSVQ